jgi:polar amino acid transport system substrate-binding protein
VEADAGKNAVMKPSARTTAPLLGGLLLLALVGCAPQDQTPPTSNASPGSSSSAPACTKDQLPVNTPGKFTVGTDKPAYAPWFVEDKPANGKGYESAVAYAVAGKLGFQPADVTWVVVPFTNAYAPGKKSFDVDINQVSITDARRKAVDFSSGYYDVAQTVITTKGSAIAGAKSVADLKAAKLGAQVGTTSYTAITDQIQPSKKPGVYDTNDLAVQALKNHQVDGIVVDLPTAFYITGAELDDGVIVGQLPPGSGKLDQFGLVLAKGSALTGCVSQAVDALKADGTLAALESKWLSGTGGAPKLS